jgi:uncharacterized protein YuzE
LMRSVSGDMVSVEFDPEVNALYLRLSKGKVSSSEPIADNITVDLNEQGRIVGFELLLPPTMRDEVKAQLTEIAKI